MKGGFGAGSVEWYRWTISFFYYYFLLFCVSVISGALPGPHKMGRKHPDLGQLDGTLALNSADSSLCVELQLLTLGLPNSPFLYPKWEIKLGLFQLFGFFFFMKKNNIDFCC